MKKLLAGLLLLCGLAAAHAQTANQQPATVPNGSVSDLGNGPFKVRVVQGSAYLFTSQGSGTGSTSGSSTSLTLTATPAAGTTPCVGCKISGTGITDGTTVAAYNGTTGITLSAAMSVSSGTSLSWGAACPAAIGTAPYIQANASADFWPMYTNARVCALTQGGPYNWLLTQPFTVSSIPGGGGGSTGSPGGSNGQLQYNNAGTFGGTPTGTGILSMLGNNVGAAGAPVAFNGALGTPSSGTLSNATGLPISTGVSGLGAGVATWLGTPSSANLRGALTDETGTGFAFFQGGNAGAFTATSLTLSGASLAGGAVLSAAGNITTNSAFVGPTLFGGVNANSTVLVQASANANPSGDTAELRGSTVNIGASTPTALTVNMGVSPGGGVTFNFGGAGNGVSAYNVYTSGGSKQTWVSGGGNTTVTFPAATDTLVGKATTDTFTNKTLNCGSTGNACTVRVANDISGFGTGIATALTINTGTAGAPAILIASGTSALGTSAISSAACASVVTTAATGVATTDVVTASFNGDPTAVTGYVPSTSGMLTIFAYPTANNVNFKVCNNTGSSVTPGAITLNWRVVR